MLKTQVASFWFDRHEKINRYSDYAKVWKFSADKMLTKSDVTCTGTTPPDFKSHCPVFYRGNRKIGPSKTLSWLKKIDLWSRVEINKPTLLCDVDIAFFGDPWPEVMDLDWDVGICGHNTGAVYFRGNSKSKSFFQDWHNATHYLFNNPELYKEYDKKYKGLDQASFGYLMDTGNYSANVVQLPRRFHSIWNDYEEPCYLMHYHSALRSTVFNDKDIDILPKNIHKYFHAWNDYLHAADED